MKLTNYINLGDISKARVFYPDGAVETYDNQKLRIAFRERINL